MPDAYIIEVGGRTAGIVTRDSRDDAFNFYAAARKFEAMEGQSFIDPVAAESAARHLARHGSSSRRSEPDRDRS